MSDGRRGVCLGGDHSNDRSSLDRLDKVRNTAALSAHSSRARLGLTDSNIKNQTRVALGFTVRGVKQLRAPGSSGPNLCKPKGL